MKMTIEELYVVALELGVAEADIEEFLEENFENDNEDDDE